MAYRRAVGLVALGVCAAALVAQARGQESRLLLDNELHEHVGEVVSIEDARLTLRVGGSVRTTDVDAWLAILPADEPARSARRIPLAPVGVSPAMHQLIELTDGQRLFGRLIERDAEESLLWEVPGLGEASVPLERVSRLRLVSSERETATPEGEDAVILLNGDVLRGFVEKIGHRLMIDTGASVLPLGWSLVREVRLSNPVEVSPGALVYLRDGAVVGVRGAIALAGEGGGLRARLGEPFELASADAVMSDRVTLAREDVLAIALAPERLAPIAGLEIESVEAAEGRVFAPALVVGDAREALLGAANIEISGPVRVEWILPEGAIRAAGVARLPDSATLWGDYEFVLSERGERGPERELLRLRVNGAAPRHAFSVALDGSLRGARLVLRIESGAFGPIQDRLVLERGLILLTPDSTDRR